MRLSSKTTMPKTTKRIYEREKERKREKEMEKKERKEMEKQKSRLFDEFSGVVVAKSQ